MLSGDEHSKVEWMVGKILCVPHKTLSSVYTSQWDHKSYHRIFHESQLKTTISSTDQAHISIITESWRQYMSEYERKNTPQLSRWLITIPNKILSTVQELLDLTQ